MCVCLIWGLICTQSRGGWRPRQPPHPLPYQPKPKLTEFSGNYLTVGVHHTLIHKMQVKLFTCWNLAQSMQCRCLFCRNIAMDPHWEAVPAMQAWFCFSDIGRSALLLFVAWYQKKWYWAVCVGKVLAGNIVFCRCAFKWSAECGAGEWRGMPRPGWLMWNTIADPAPLTLHSLMDTFLQSAPLTLSYGCFSSISPLSTWAFHILTQLNSCKLIIRSVSDELLPKIFLRCNINSRWPNQPSLKEMKQCSNQGLCKK